MLNEDLNNPLPHVTSYSYANGGGGEKGCGAFWKVPGLNTPYNAISEALMTAF